MAKQGSRLKWLHDVLWLEGRQCSVLQGQTKIEKLVAIYNVPSLPGTQVAKVIGMSPTHNKLNWANLEKDWLGKSER